MLDENIKAFVIYVSFLNLRLKIITHPAKKTQIALLFIEKVLILAKYLDFANIFLKKSAQILPEQTRASKYTIMLEKSDQLPYRLIYSLGLIELETLKSYIKINLVNGFMKASKLPESALIHFDHKLNGSYCLCVNY